MVWIRRSLVRTVYYYSTHKFVSHDVVFLCQSRHETTHTHKYIHMYDISNICDKFFSEFDEEIHVKEEDSVTLVCPRKSYLDGLAWMRCNSTHIEPLMVTNRSGFVLWSNYGGLDMCSRNQGELVIRHASILDTAMYTCYFTINGTPQVPYRILLHVNRKWLWGSSHLESRWTINIEAEWRIYVSVY